MFHLDSYLFTDKQLWSLLRIRRSDTIRVLRVLKLYDKQLIDCGNGSSFSGEEIFLISWFKFVTGASSSSMELIFHRDEAELSAAFIYFVTHIMNNFAYLLTDNLEFWRKYFPACAEVICNNLSAACGVQKDPSTFRVLLL